METDSTNQPEKAKEVCKPKVDKKKLQASKKVKEDQLLNNQIVKKDGTNNGS